MPGDFQDLIEALERFESSSAAAREKVRTLRQEPTRDNAQAVLAELRALHQELRQIEKYLRPDSRNEIMDLVHVLSDTLHPPFAGQG
jgi:hypothetical protein